MIAVYKTKEKKPESHIVWKGKKKFTVSIRERRNKNNFTVAIQWIVLIDFTNHLTTYRNMIAVYKTKEKKHRKYEGEKEIILRLQYNGLCWLISAYEASTKSGSAGIRRSNLRRSFLAHGCVPCHEEGRPLSLCCRAVHRACRRRNSLLSSMSRISA